jgi:hypothetical protein
MPKAPVQADEETDTVRERPAPQADKRVSIVVTKFGAGKVSTGVHVTGEGDIYAAKGDKLEVDESTAKLLEARGLAEIV